MLNPNYAVAMDEQGQQYPALQAVDYQPKPGQNVRFALSDDSADLLTQDAYDKLQLEKVTTYYGDNEAEVNQINAEFRCVLLGFPKLFVYDKDERTYSHLSRGLKLAGTGKVTATRLLIAIMIDGDFLYDAEGSIQLFTLKLTSTKTKFLQGDRNDPSFRSMKDLNDALLKHYKIKRGCVLHLVSVAIKIKPEKFTSRASGASSFGIMFEFDGNAKPLTEEHQALLYHLAQSDEVTEFLQDPFRLKTQSESPSNNDGDYAKTEEDMDPLNIPF